MPPEAVETPRLGLGFPNTVGKKKTSLLQGIQISCGLCIGKVIRIQIHVEKEVHLVFVFIPFHSFLLLLSISVGRCR